MKISTNFQGLKGNFTKAWEGNSKHTCMEYIKITTFMGDL